MDRNRRQVPILGRSSRNILARKAFKKNHRRHRKALKNVKASTDNKVPASLRMKHLKLRLNTRVGRVRKVQKIMVENQRMLAKFQELGKNGHQIYDRRLGVNTVLSARNDEFDRYRGSRNKAYRAELERQRVEYNKVVQRKLRTAQPALFGRGKNMQGWKTTKEILQEYNQTHGKLKETLKQPERLILSQWKQKRAPRLGPSPSLPREPSPVFMSKNRASHRKNMSFSGSKKPRESLTKPQPSYDMSAFLGD